MSDDMPLPPMPGVALDLAEYLKPHIELTWSVISSALVAYRNTDEEILLIAEPDNFEASLGPYILKGDVSPPDLELAKKCAEQALASLVDFDIAVSTQL